MYLDLSYLVSGIFCVVIIAFRGTRQVLSTQCDRLDWLIGPNMIAGLQRRFTAFASEARLVALVVIPRFALVDRPIRAGLS